MEIGRCLARHRLGAVAAVLCALGMGPGQARFQVSQSANQESGRRSSSLRAGSEDRQPVGDKQILADSETVFPMDDNLVLRGYSNRRWIAQPASITHASERDASHTRHRSMPQ